MEKLSFKIAEYDAPLDLILNLLSRHKLNILDIDISSLLEQYMERIHIWQQVDMEVSSEFLEMASRLVYIKTVSLLPRHEEETERLRSELTGQLIEYRLCKLAAEQLGSWSRYGDIFVRPPIEMPMDETYTLTHPSGILYAALADAQGKESRRLPPSHESFEALVTRPVISVTSKIFTVLRALRTDRAVHLDRLFDHSAGKSGVVATFLAVLELIKSKKVLLQGEQLQLIDQQ